ncbi:hypothetical protein OsJ_15098 [Oryza sativa Japonica Group]|uniref:Uncharacterized protein n=1 Tax=Oryza sativa subsp. japonica TaxID=39947 RepID=B9FFL2_ORYSJ|nr:hypothetical protein OsJ_15098 [Oryza sativa Japonica Group]
MAPGKLAVFALLASLLLLNTIKAADYPPAPPLGPPPHKIVDPRQRLRGGVRRAVQRALAQEAVQPLLPHVLQRVPLRPGGHGRQPGDLRQVLHRLGLAQQHDQVPVS